MRVTRSLEGCADSLVSTSVITVSPATAPLRVLMDTNRVIQHELLGDLDVLVGLTATGTCGFAGMGGNGSQATYTCSQARNATFVLGFQKYGTCDSAGVLVATNIRIQAFECPATDIGGASLPARYATAVVNGICQTGEQADADKGAPRYRCQADSGWTLIAGSCVPSNSGQSGSKDQGASSKSSTGAIAGAVLGGLALLGLVAALVYHHRKRRRVPANFFQQSKGGLVENFTMNLHYKDIQKQFSRQGDYEVNNSCCARMFWLAATAS